MRKLLIILIFLFVSVNLDYSIKLFSQIDARNTVYFEVGGIGGWYSINYDRIFLVKNKIKLSSGIGISLSVFQFDKENNIKFRYSPRIPLQLNLLVGQYKHNLKLGFGTTPYWYKDQKIYLASFFIIGYRYQKPDGGVFYNVEFSPNIYDWEFKFFPWGGIGIGYSF